MWLVKITQSLGKWLDWHFLGASLLKILDQLYLKKLSLLWLNGETVFLSSSARVFSRLYLLPQRTIIHISLLDFSDIIYSFQATLYSTRYICSQNKRGEIHSELSQGLPSCPWTLRYWRCLMGPHRPCWPGCIQTMGWEISMNTSESH